ncbi:putative dehydrogenase [Planctomycetales bacterium 10988]|nr:putative dehydrogenase [Planctomycetales bacterium 10988]
MTQPNQSSNQASRRDFLTTSGAVAAGGALLSTMAVPQRVHAGADETIRIGLIGCGGRGTKAAVQALSTEGSVKLVCMADAFGDRMETSIKNIQKKAPDSFDVPQERQFVGFDAYKKVLAQDIQMVILATPPGFRPLHFEAAVSAGKHVFMEKPVAVDGAGVRKVLEVNEMAKSQGLCVGVGLQRHHQNTYLETMKRLKDGMIGDFVSMRAYWNGAGVWTRPREPQQTEMEYQMRNWYYFNWLCGDHIVEQHIHNLDVINWLKDDYPVEAQGQGGRLVRTGPDSGQIFDHHQVEFTYADGTKMFSYCRHMPNCWNSVSEHVAGTKGTADISRAVIEPNKGEGWRMRERKNDPYQQEHDDLFAAIRYGQPYNEADNGAKSTMTAVFGRMCTYSGNMLTWDEALNSKLVLAPEIGTYTFEMTPPVTPDKDGKYPVAMPGKTSFA